MVFSDTPGILKPSYKLQESMMEFVKGAFTDADIILYVTDTVENPEKNKDYVERLNKMECPVIVVINKIDLTNQQKLERLVEEWHKRVPAAEIFPTSALNRFNLDSIFNRIKELLPQQHAWYDRDALTDRNLRFFASEIIREKILLNYQKEIPYCTEVVIEKFEEGKKLYNIDAVINVMRESQRGIIIGSKGSLIKKVGIEARKEMELFFQKRVYLSLFVKVDAGWRENEKELKRFGYIN